MEISAESLSSFIDLLRVRDRQGEAPPQRVMAALAILLDKEPAHLLSSRTANTDPRRTEWQLLALDDGWIVSKSAHEHGDDDWVLGSHDAELPGEDTALSAQAWPVAALQGLRVSSIDGRQDYTSRVWTFTTSLSVVLNDGTEIPVPVGDTLDAETACRDFVAALRRAIAAA